MPVQRLRMRPHPVIFALGLFLVYLSLSLLIYRPALTAPLYYDSASRIGNNEHRFTAGFSSALNVFPQRPAAMASFWLNYRAAGMSPFWFRVTNCLFLALTALSVVWLVRLVLRAGSIVRVSPSAPWWVPPVCGLLFLVHPMQFTVTVYIWQRMALLACLFSVLAVCLYLKARLSRSTASIAWFSLAMLSFAAGLGSKENAIVVPVIVMMAEIAFFGVRARSFALVALVGMILVLAAAGVLSHVESAHGLGKTLGLVQTVRDYYAESGLTLRSVLISQVPVFFVYLAMVLVPVPSNVALFRPQPVLESLLDPFSTAVATGGLVLYLALSLWCMRKRPVAGFGLLFVPVAMIPEAVLVPQYFFLGYRVVLPSVGLVLVLAYALAELGSRTPVGLIKRAWCGAVFIGTLTVFLGWSTYVRAEIWSSPLAFWQEVVNRLPEKVDGLEKDSTLQAFNSLGLELQRQGRYAESIPYHEKALAVRPDRVSTLVWLANALFHCGDSIAARTYLDGAVSANPSYPDAYMVRGDILRSEGRTEEAVQEYHEAVRHDRGHPHFAAMLGRILLECGKAQQAADILLRAIELAPDRSEHHFLMGKALMQLGRGSEALDHFEAAVALQPTHWQAHNDAGVLLARTGRQSDALRHFQAALEQKPDDPGIRSNIEAILLEIGNRSPQ